MLPRDPFSLQKASSWVEAPRSAAAAVAGAAVVVAVADADAAVVSASAPAAAAVHVPRTTHDRRFPAPPGAARRPSKEGVQRTVTSEVAGLTAFETGKHRGRGLIDRPTSRYPGKRLHGRPCEVTRPVRVWCCISYLHRAPFDGHLPYQIKKKNWSVLPGPSRFE